MFLLDKDQPDGTNVEEQEYGKAIGIQSGAVGDASINTEVNVAVGIRSQDLPFVE